MASRLRLPTASNDEMRMTLIEHLDELRSRILKIGVAFVAVCVVAWFFRVQVFEWLLAPATEILGGQLNFTNVTDPILTDIKITLYVGFMLTLPILLYQIWAFVAPAVGELGRVFTYTLITLASSLFLAGVAFGYYIVLPMATNLLLGWGGERFNPIVTGAAYLSFVTRFLLAFGIAFEVPAATYVGAKLGVINAPFLRRYRRVAIMVNIVVAALLTPADPFSMLFMAVPLLLLYELSILIAARVNPVSPEDEPDEFDEEDEDYEEDER